MDHNLIDWRVVIFYVLKIYFCCKTYIPSGTHDRRRLTWPVEASVFLAVTRLLNTNIWSPAAPPLLGELLRGGGGSGEMAVDSAEGASTVLPSQDDPTRGEEVVARVEGGGVFGETSGDGDLVSTKPPDLRTSRLDSIEVSLWRTLSITPRSKTSKADIEVGGRRWEGEPRSLGLTLTFCPLDKTIFLMLFLTLFLTGEVSPLFPPPRLFSLAGCRHDNCHTPYAFTFSQKTRFSGEISLIERT